MKYALITLILFLTVAGVALGDTVDIQGALRDARSQLKDSVKGPEWLSPNEIPEMGSDVEPTKPDRRLHSDSMYVLDEVVPKDVPITEDSTGLKYREFLVGTGQQATGDSFARVIWSIWLADSTGMKPEKFFKSTSGDTMSVAVFVLVPGWRQGMVGMKEGGVRRIYVPYQKGYGEAGTKVVPPKANMIIDVKLVKITELPQPPATLRNQAKTQQQSGEQPNQQPVKPTDATKGKP